jgi:hypothetical protein
MCTAINTSRFLTSRITTLTVTALLLVGCSQLTFGQQSGAKTFASAGQASHALYEAVKGKDESAVRAILGAGPELTSSGNDTEDKLNRERFAQKYQEMHRLVREADGTAILHIGAENWPFPIPLISKAGKWYFDADAGSQELLAREIGRNEVTAIQVCQRAEESNGPNTEKADGQDPIREFAAALASQKDAKSADRGPFNGYYFRSVSGVKPPDVVLIAYPAEYWSSGVMTFIVTRNGSVYEKDLGPQTPTAAQQVQGAPAKGWVPVQQSSMP